MLGNTYIDVVLSTTKKAWETQSEQFAVLKEKMIEAIRTKHSIYLFGCSHAGILAEEMFYRTGGLALINPIFFPGFMLNTRPITMTSKLERVEGIGKVLLDQNHVKAGDFLLIHSVSGRNTVPVEMAIEARKMGVFVACITNLEYSRSVTSRHPAGKNLYEVCDVVIDNCGALGDAAIEVPGLAEHIGPTSTAVGTAILNALVVDVIEELVNAGEIPPIFMSANLDGGDEHNKTMMEEYKDNIFYM